MKKVLITGAGTGFGYEVALRLAEKGFEVIAGVEIYAQVQTLKRQATERGVTLQVEKLDVTNDGDRRKALGWDVEILVNNASVGEGGSTVDIPAANIRNEFEVNVTGPLLLTQGIAKQMVKRGEGRIVWVSSREGLNVNPFTGIYAASKHAVEAIAETMADELQELGIQVATINPGPFRLQRPHVPDVAKLGGRAVGEAVRLLEALLPPRPVRSRAGIRDDDCCRGRGGRHVPQPRAEIDDRGDQEPAAGALGSQGHRRPRHAIQGRAELVRHGARDPSLGVTARQKALTR
jgi:NAD(P)-dependent dehydrogenase (short-subunit alcohol dehydrogenase family)